MRILVINGPNLNLLGIREPEIYGDGNYYDLCEKINLKCRELNIDVDIFQSNHEGEIVDKIGESYKETDGIIINPAAYTHTSIAIADALKAVSLPYVEVHISDLSKREEFRQISYIRDEALATVMGKGFDGYLEAIDILNTIVTLELSKGYPCGEVEAPPSKSYTHRALILGAFSKQSIIKNVVLSEDIFETIDCLRNLGANVGIEDDTVTIGGLNLLDIKNNTEIYCGDSGSTLRFLIPICLLAGSRVTFKGTERLLSRPLDEYEKFCKEVGFSFEKNRDSVTVFGNLSCGDYKITSSVSSQYVTGLLLALSVIEGKSTVEVVGKIESKPYIYITVDILKKFGIDVSVNENTITVIGKQLIDNKEYAVEFDASNSAYLEALNFVGNIRVNSTDNPTVQGDIIYKEMFSRLKNGEKKFDLEDCPDLAPIMFSASCLFGGAEFTGTRRLQYKESNRNVTMKQELEKFGVLVKIEENSVIINAENIQKPTKMLVGHNDHRVVMALALLCVKYGGKIRGAQAVKKSFPNFFDRLEELGVKLKEI